MTAGLIKTQLLVCARFALQGFSGAAAAASSLPATEFVMKLKPGLTRARLNDICNELGNATSGRFSGFCRYQTGAASLEAGADPDQELDWSFQAFTVKALVGALLKFGTCSTLK